MDPFTQNLINRTKQRQEYLKAKQSGLPPSEITTHSENIRVSSPLRETSSSSMINGGKSSPTLKSASKQQVELGKENGQGLQREKDKPTSNFKPKYQQKDDIDFVKTSTLKSQEEKTCEDMLSPQKDARKNRLANLAHQINDWEDESYLCSKSASSTPVKNSKDVPKYGAPKPSTSTPTKLDYGQKGMSKTPRMDQNPVSAKKQNQDSPSLKQQIEEGTEKATPTKAVESQGFTPTASRSRLIFEFEKERGEPVEEEQAKSWTYAAGSPVKTANRYQISSPSESPLRNVPKTIVSSSALKEIGSPLRSGPSFSALKASPAKPNRSSPLKTTEVVASSRLSSVRSPSKSNSRLPAVSSKPSPQKPSGPSSISDNGPAVSVLKRAAMFDSPRPIPKDPTELSLSERKALFEKNKGQPPTPKVTTAASSGFRSKVPAAPFTSQTDGAQKLGFQKQIVEQSLEAQRNVNSAKAMRMKELDEIRNRHNHRRQKSENAEDSPNRNVNFQPKTPEPPKYAPPPPPLPSPVKVVAVSPKKNLADSQAKISSSSKPNTPLDSYPGLDRCKPIRVSPPKPGRLYPCLSDLEMTTDKESESEEDYEENDQSRSDKEAGALDCSQDMDSSFTVDILGKAGLSQFINTPKRKLQEMQDTKPTTQGRMRSVEEQSEGDSDEMADISDLLNEALEDPNSEPTPPKHRKNDAEDVGGPYPLYHSVSFYRKQKQELTVTPVKQVVRNPEVQVESCSEEKANAAESQRVQINQQIRLYQEEINAQQIVMSQASQALNLCRATAEFSGSTEQVEGERLLLVASQKRQAAVNEIQRLKTDAALRKASEDLASSGTLSISNLALPLKKEFLAMLSKGGDDFIHYFVILVRSRGQVIPTQMVSTIDGIQDGALRFPNLIQLRDLSADFNVAIEVYALQTRKEKLPHEAKYHIRKESSKMRLTPKKLLNKQESRLLSTPTISSPAGPNAIRSSSFGLVGIASITPVTLHRKHWTLEKVPFASPIEGSFAMKIQSHTDSLIEERGFLTVFEDVGGFGAWHRRWCYLSNDQLLFWKYPDDEKRKEPLAHISLRSCITEHVDVVSRDICARPNTFLLVTVRQPQPGDKDSLVMTCYSHRTALRHLLSADLKEERQVWCKQINRVLANLRAWDPDSQKPSVDGAANCITSKI